MAIYARELAVRDYRSFEAYELELAESITVLVGENAVGKTNLVEALQLLTAGVSFRRPTPAELVREGCDRAHIALSLTGDGRVIDLACEVAQGKRSFSRNGKRCTAAGVRGVVPSVLFCPDDLDMVKRSASVRRSALDSFGMQLNERYAQLVGAYERIVEQRNSLLKEPWCSRELLGAWDDSLAQTGAALMAHRMALLERVRAHLVAVYGHIAPHEVADVAYRASIDEAAAEAGAGVATEGAAANLSSATAGAPPSSDSADREALVQTFRAALAASYEDERRRGITLVGPHRDDIAFTIDGRDARRFASQGQQRSLVLAWKVAEVEVTRDILGRPPLLLLDDVMSELDARRRAAFLRHIQEEVQTVITTTNLGYFSDDILARACVVPIGCGLVGDGVVSTHCRDEVARAIGPLE